ncbi:MAG: hypothetical protein N2321_03690 [Melioribacteraceae bacterium]|nr:hypothetical protein [Melioribacteraceae bacterium]
MNENIPIENVVKGLIVAEPVVNRYGQVIINKDTVINESHFRVLKIWGIKSVVIKTLINENKESKISSEEVKNGTNSKINWLPSNEIEEELYSLALEIINKKESI